MPHLLFHSLKSGHSIKSPTRVSSSLSPPACGHGSIDDMSHALHSARRLTRHKLLVSCATLAIAAAAMAPQRASAQAFQGTPTTAAGTVSYARSTAGSETITVGSGTATINWAPTDTQGTGNINFLPFGNTATYQGAPGLAAFTALNRIVPTDTTRTIELNG